MSTRFAEITRPSSSIRLCHWNIRELDSQELSAADSAQIQAAGLVLGDLAPDIFSLNEIHDDRLRAAKLGHDNLQDFLKRWDPSQHLEYRCLVPSNTGSRARTDVNGAYLTQMPDIHDSRQNLIDRSNFGLFPGQYATALASHYRCSKSQIIQNLKWLDWQADRQLTNFSLGGVKPEEIELFDKSFSVHWLDCLDRSVAVICLHSVPAFNFGQKHSPNALRNADQLAFLQWFLLGEPTPSPAVLGHLQRLGIEPLASDQAFIAVGDFNTPLGDPRYPGGKIIQAMLDHPRIHPRQALIDPFEQAYLPAIEPNTSFFSSGWNTRRLATQLDYILVSKELQIERLSVVYAAPQALIHAISPDWQELSSQLHRYQRQDRVVKIFPNYGAKAGQEFRLVSAERDFALLREASDHLPLVLDFTCLD